MENDILDETEIFACMGASRARFLLIGRKALVAYGAPVMTADYDVWLHIDDIEVFNGALLALDFAPNWDSAAARTRGRYVLEGSDQIDVHVARACSTPAGVVLGFEDAYARSISLGEGEGAVHCRSDHDQRMGLAPEGHRRHRVPSRVAEIGLLMSEAPKPSPSLVDEFYERVLPP